MPSWLLKLVEVLVGTVLMALAANVLSGKRRFPGPFDVTRRYPLETMLAGTAGLVALEMYRRDTTDGQRTSFPPLIEKWRLDRLRSELLNRVRRDVEAQLASSLGEVGRIELRLTERPNLVVPLHVRHPRPDLTGMSFIQIADALDRRLLILGQPGAGKTTLLLELADHLLACADRDARERIPVIFDLSTWPVGEHQQEGPELVEWLADELFLQYDVSPRLALQLVDQDELVVLLDGLDAIPTREGRVACAQAINAFRREHASAPIAVCVRTNDYEDLAAINEVDQVDAGVGTKLVLNGAVEVQPLQKDQVLDWLAATGEPLGGLREVLSDHNPTPEHGLWALLDRPLFVWIVALSYKGRPASALPRNTDTKQLMTQLFDTYVDRMLAEKMPARQHTEQQGSWRKNAADTKRWLAWLAADRREAFSPDLMEPDSLRNPPQEWLITAGLGLAALLIASLAIGLIFGLAFGLATGLFFGLISGLAVGQALGLARPDAPGGSIRPQWSPIRRLRWSLIIGLPIGTALTLAEGLAVMPVYGIGIGLSEGLGVMLAVGLAVWLSAPANEHSIDLGSDTSATRRWALILAVVFGLAVGLRHGLASIFHEAPDGLGIQLGLAEQRDAVAHPWGATHRS